MDASNFHHNPFKDLCSIYKYYVTNFHILHTVLKHTCDDKGFDKHSLQECIKF